MKRLLAILILIFTLQTPSQAEDIRDFQIEGMSIGDSLLDYISKEKILSEKENSKNIYGGLGKQIFFEAYYREKAGAFENYDYLSFFVKSDDEDFIIQAIYAVKYYLKDIDKCYIQHNEVVAELGNIFKNEKKIEERDIKINWDPTGKSKLKRTVFNFGNGDVAAVECYDWDESMQKGDPPNPDIISVSINKKDLYNWLN